MNGDFYNEDKDDKMIETTLDERIKHAAETLENHKEHSTFKQLRDLMFDDIHNAHNIPYEDIQRAVLREQINYQTGNGYNRRK